jgi:hypothetical protein
VAVRETSSSSAPWRQAQVTVTRYAVGAGLTRERCEWASGELPPDEIAKAAAPHPLDGLTPQLSFGSLPVDGSILIGFAREPPRILLGAYICRPQWGAGVRVRRMPEFGIQQLFAYYLTDGNLDMTSYDGHAWSPPVHIAITGLSTPPSILSAQGQLTMFANLGGQLGVAASQDGSVWGTMTNTGVALNNTPVGVIGPDDVEWVFFQRGSGELWYVKPSNGQYPATQVANVGMSGSPAPVVYQDSLYVFHQGLGNDGWLWCSQYSSGAWQADVQLTQVGMSASPCAVVYDSTDRLYVFHQGRGNDGWLWCSQFNGKTWQLDSQIPDVGMSGSPSAIEYGGKLYVLHQGRGNNDELWVSAFDSTEWSPDAQVGAVEIDDGPATAVL